MSGRRQLLLLDGLVNLLLGLVLVTWRPRLIELLGLPAPGWPFYALILGGVLIGIGLALMAEWRWPGRGLGLGGAIIINFCGAAVVIGLLLWGGLDIPLRGRVMLWLVGGGVALLGLIEAAAGARSHPVDQSGSG